MSLNPTEAGVLKWLARLSAISSSLILAYLAVAQGPPVSPEGTGIQRDAHYAFALIALGATLMAWFAPLAGGWLLVVAGVVLGIAAAARYSEETALAGAVALVIPGILFLILGTSNRRLSLQLTFVIGVAVLLVYGGCEASERHERAFGPHHPASPLEAQPFDRVEWVWSGAVTATGFTVNARIAEEVGEVRLAVGPDESLSSAVYSEPKIVDPEESSVVSMTIDGLKPDTDYNYAVEVDGELDSLRRGRLRTFPSEGASFSIAVASCARTGSSGAVFDRIREDDAVLYLITGDAHYENITRDRPGRFREAYNTMLTAPAQAALYRETPIAYVWDDHDFGGNNSDSDSDAREAARLAYREHVPHYDLPAGEGNAPIYQAFSVGDVRFILLDTRSVRDAEEMPDGSDSMLGREQRDWLKRELASGSASHSLVALVSSVPWIAPAEEGRDDWGGYATEREEIATFIADNEIDNLLMLSGDAHMLAIDDGSNSDYAPGGGAAFPVFQAAALDRPGSVKGGPYSEGTYPGPGQYGRVTFRQDGEALTVQLSGRNWRGEEIVAHSFRVPLADRQR